MDFTFRADQTDLRDLARKILEDKVTNERLKQIEGQVVVFDADLWRELAKSHLLGITIPEPYEGAGFGFFELCLLLQEIGRSVAPIPAFATLVLGALPVARFGSDEQKQAWLPGVATGDVFLSAGLCELDSADAADPSTTAKRDGRGWRLEGQKSGVPATELATRILVPARNEDGRVGVFLVDPTLEGVHLEAQETTSRQPHSQLTLSGVQVDEAALLGGLEQGTTIVQWMSDHATVALCALQLGVSERALEMTARYTAERRQFDRAIGSFQAVHQRAADAYVNVDAIRLSTWEAAWRLSEERPADDAIAIAKYWAAEGGHFVAYACQHLHGGVGIDVDYPLHRYFIWTTMLEHTLGSAPSQLAKLGARLAERGLPDDV